MEEKEKDDQYGTNTFIGFIEEKFDAYPKMAVKRWLEFCAVDVDIYR